MSLPINTPYGWVSGNRFAIEFGGINVILMPYRDGIDGKRTRLLFIGDSTMHKIR